MDHCTTHVQLANKMGLKYIYIYIYIISQGYGKGGKVLFPKQQSWIDYAVFLSNMNIQLII
jgi:hypothetical protein